MTETAQVPIDLIDPVKESKPRKRGNGKALTTVSEAPAPAPVSGGDAMLALFERMARDPTIDPARIQEFLRMKRDEEDRQALRAFNAAMAAAKAEFEPIVKRHLVNRGSGGTYKHEDLADISAAVDPALSRHGLNTRYRTTSNPNEPITCTFIITHEAGHSEETTLSAGADSSGGKNSIQAIASTLSYLQRMAKKAGLGLAAARDDDGRAAGETKPIERITEQQAKDLEALAKRADVDLQIIYDRFNVKALHELTLADAKLATNRCNSKLKLMEGVRP